MLRIIKSLLGLARLFYHFSREMLVCDLWFFGKVSSSWRVEYNCKKKKFFDLWNSRLRSIFRQILYTYFHQVEGVGFIYDSTYRNNTLCRVRDKDTVITTYGTYVTEGQTGRRGETKKRKQTEREQNEQLNRHFSLFFRKKRVCLKVHLLHDGTFKTVNFYGPRFLLCPGVRSSHCVPGSPVLMRIYSSELITRH